MLTPEMPPNPGAPVHTPPEHIAAAPDAALPPRAHEHDEKTPDVATTSPLTHAELRSIPSLEVARRLYQECGLSPSSDHNTFIKQIAADWNRACREKFERDWATEDPNPEQHPVMRVMGADGREHEILRVSHTIRVGSEYIARLKTATDASGYVLAEQGMNKVFGSFGIKCVELPDHGAGSIRHRLLREVLFLPSGIKEFIVEDGLQALRSFFGGAERRQRAAAYDAQFRNLRLRVDPAIRTQLPPGIHFDNKRVTGVPLTESEERSAYLAAVLLKVPEGIPRRILCGLSHAPEVEYFLAHPHTDGRISRLAETHAALFNAGPVTAARNLRWVKLREAATMQVVRLLPAMVAGGILAAL